MNNTQIFNHDEIFNICKSYAIAYSNSIDFFNWIDILSTNDEEAFNKICALSESTKKRFLNQLQKTVQKNFNLFNNIPDNIDNEEDFSKQQAILQELADNWENDLKEFIKYD